MTSSKRKLHVVEDELPKRRVRRWKSDAERRRLPLATTTDGKGAPLLPKQTHEALEDLLGKGK